jgi:hypothetical protein
MLATRFRGDHYADLPGALWPRLMRPSTLSTRSGAMVGMALRGKEIRSGAEVMIGRG